MQHIDALIRNPVEELKPASMVGVQVLSLEKEDWFLTVQLQDYKAPCSDFAIRG